MIERQVQHLLRLVDDLLDVARVARGNVELRRRAVDLEEAIETAVELASPLLEEKRHHLLIEVEKAIAVDADPARLRQVIANLVTNAAKYTPAGGHISVCALRDRGDARVEVKDDGIGIAPEFLPRIFETFVQGERGIDRSQGGLGLGLAIVKSLVSLHGGRIQARSPGVGKGSTFTFWLAAASDDVPRRSDERTVRREAADRARRVLVVDDNEDAAFMLSEAIRSFGHEVRTTYMTVPPRWRLPSASVLRWRCSISGSR